MRHLTNMLPGKKILIDGTNRFKTTYLSVREIRRGVQHVREVQKRNSYSELKGELRTTMDSIEHQSQVSTLVSKVNDTILLVMYIEMNYVYIVPARMMRVPNPKMEPKVGEDNIIGIWDPLRRVISKISQEGISTEKPVGGRSSNSRGINNKGIEVGQKSTYIKYDARRTGSNLRLRKVSMMEGVMGLFNSPLRLNDGIGKRRYSKLKSTELNSTEIYKKAYLTLKNNEGSMTPGASPRTQSVPSGHSSEQSGVDKEDLDGMSITKLEKIAKDVREWKFEFKPVRRMYIPKANGKVRSLGIPSIRDRIVQSAMKLIMEPILEKGIFKETSHGFRPKRSCHTALIRVQRMTGITWMIEGDIKGYFDNIDHKILEELMKKYLGVDQSIINIYWKMVRAGYIEEDRREIHSLSGVPQGGIISPLLSNLYLTPLDEYMEELGREWNREPISKRNEDYRKIEHRIQTLRRKLDRDVTRSREEIEEIKEEIIKRKKELRQKNSRVRIGRKIWYVRYADDWVIGVTGTRQDAEEVKKKVKEYMKENLKIEMNEDKTKITKLTEEAAEFLGYNIKMHGVKTRIASRQAKKDMREKIDKRKAGGKPKLIIPLARLRDKLKGKGMINEKGRPKAIGRLIYLPDREIILRYNAIMRGIINYYIIAENRSELNEAIYIIRSSLIHTLAAKHRQSTTKIMNKYGKNPKVEIKKEEGDKIIMFDPPRSLSAASLNSKYGERREKLIDPMRYIDFDIKETNYLLERPCYICGSKEKVEMHHLRRLKDTKDKGTLIKIMAKMNRKTIPVCRNCHMKIHKGEYDGMSLKELRTKLEYEV